MIEKQRDDILRTAMTQETDVFVKGNCPYGASSGDFSKDLNYFIALITFNIASEYDTIL